MHTVIQIFLGTLLYQVFMKILLPLSGIFSMIVMTLMFSFTSDYALNKIKDPNILTRTGIRAVKNVRHNVRIVWGTLLPIDKKLYTDLSKDEFDNLPDPKDAFYQFSPGFERLQRNSLVVMSLSSLEIEKNIVALTQSFKQISSHKNFKKVNWENITERAPASK